MFIYNSFELKPDGAKQNPQEWPQQGKNKWYNMHLRRTDESRQIIYCCARLELEIWITKCHFFVEMYDKNHLLWSFLYGFLPLKSVFRWFGLVIFPGLR